MQVNKNRQPALMNLVLEPDPLLHLQSEDVTVVDDALRDLMDDMLFTMRHNDGVGLAAVQVGVLKKVIVVDVARGEGDSSSVRMPMFLVNAKLLWCSEEKSSFNEGCLSLPGIHAEVQRSSDITVEYLDYHGKECSLKLEHELLSVCIQHEIDHTNGIIFTDRISRIKRDLLIKRMMKARKNSGA